MKQNEARAPSALAQLGLLLRLWWRHLRRRPLRIGDAPKPSGVPTFLLINVLSLAYTLPLVFRSVASDMKRDASFFAWHLLGSCALSLGNGLHKGAATLQVRGGRSDEFLAPLPLSLLARLGLQLADGYFTLLIAWVVSWAGAITEGLTGASLALSVALGLVAYVCTFIVGQTLIAAARSFGPASSAQLGGYLGAGLALSGLALSFVSVSGVLKTGLLADLVTAGWLAEDGKTLRLFGAVSLLTCGAYAALSAAERRGFDRMDAQGRAPRASKGSQSRAALEARLIWRQGGRVQMPLFTLLLVGGAVFIVRQVPAAQSSSAALMLGFMAVYTGALQIITHAGMAVRRDLKARAFLAALPLSPYQVLDGKAAALRRLTLPILAVLLFVAVLGVRHADLGLAYRALLALVALFLSVEGAVSIAFMSSGVGVVGVGGGQASSSFSTQLLLMPLLATLISGDSWSASVACLTVFVLTREAQRAARRSVRWLDDPDDALERETSVWRALLAATAFFSAQIFVGRMLALFDVPPGYSLAAAFFAGALVLSLLTWRDAARFTRPRLWPSRPWFWLLGAVGGATTAALSTWLVEQLAPASAATPQLPTQGEGVAVAITAVLLAPLAEEYFFRGWLQRAIAQDLAPARKHWAFALGALAFALAHVGSYGVPQLLLGLLAGALYARGNGLGPSMLAHAMHNGVALWFALR